jgi:uncharacterized protein (TIGR03067 family)
MAWRMLTVAVVGVLTAADVPEDKTKHLLDDFQGTWLLVAREAIGQEAKVPAAAVGDVRMIIRGSRTVTYGCCTKIEGSLHLFPKSNRVELRDWTGRAYQALYRLDGDELKLCMTPTGDCPESFGAKSGDSFIFVYRRQKPDDPDMAPAAAELKNLQGAWRMKVKKEADEESPRDLVWNFEGDEMTVQVDGKPLPDKGTVVLNPKIQPPVLGLMFSGNILVGTYSLEDDVLTFSCTQAGTPQRMIVLKRVSP